MDVPFFKSDPLTPCIKVCRVDASENYCIGCRRSLREIANWWKYTDQEKLAVLEALRTRTLPDRKEEV